MKTYYKMEMKLLTLKYVKIDAQRDIEYSGKIEVKQNIKIKSIEKYKSINSREESVKVIYNFEVNYGDLGHVIIEGLMFLSMDTKTQKNLIKNYENKKMDEIENITLMNIIIQKTSIKAIELEEEMSLPIHIKLPSIQLKD